jgi:hypothetical protein
MYERSFGRDWESLSQTEAIRRMYALGVATALGQDVPDEYDRLRAQGATPYARSVLELAFDEGKARASGVRTDYDDPEDAWEQLVEESSPSTASRSGNLEGSSRSTSTERLARTSVLELSRDELERLRLPDLLQRDR